MEMVNVLGYSVISNLDCINSSVNSSNIVINTINAYSYVLAKKDSNFKDALLKADILLPDGFPIVIAARVLSRKRIRKIAGADIFYKLLKIQQDNKGKIFFLGASERTLGLIKDRIRKEYPDVNVDVYSPPFKALFSSQDNERMINAINRFCPDVLFVGMTAPKQEKWVAANKNKIDADVICSIGAVFDFYAKTVERPSEIWIRLNLEWFNRFLKEPKRLWKRYFIYSPIFFLDLFKELIHAKYKKGKGN